MILVEVLEYCLNATSLSFPAAAASTELLNAETQRRRKRPSLLKLL